MTFQRRHRSRRPTESAYCKWATILNFISAQAFLLVLQVARSVTSLMKQWKNSDQNSSWNKARLVVEPVGQEEVGSNFCYLSGSAIRQQGSIAGLKIQDWNFGPKPDTTVEGLKVDIK